MKSPLRVTVWNEGAQDDSEPGILTAYPNGIHSAIAEGLRELLPDDSTITVATLDLPEHGLAPEVLANTDVLVWWGHLRHKFVSDDVVTRIHERVLDGMGLVLLHSSHFSKIFIKLMGTSCSIRYRDASERQVVWPIFPGHPIAAGITSPIVIQQDEMYGEYFDIPIPDELVFISSWEGGEVFRSGITYLRGNGKVFYFSPGHETYPVYFDPQIRRVIANAVRWASPRDSLVPLTLKLTNEMHTDDDPAFRETGWFLK
jgi:trehalose utilization protein